MAYTMNLGTYSITRAEARGALKDLSGRGTRAIDGSYSNWIPRQPSICSGRITTHYINMVLKLCNSRTFATETGL
ncbi:hypothetical protein LINPERHAP1_LOCUS6194 [Linum perenne]